MVYEQEHFAAYIQLVDRYEIIPSAKRGAFAGPQHATQDPTRRRESKIAQYKMEKEIKGILEVRAFVLACSRGVLTPA